MQATCALIPNKAHCFSPLMHSLLVALLDLARSRSSIFTPLLVLVAYGVYAILVRHLVYATKSPANCYLLPGHGAIAVSFHR
eukprot:COSAG05_NODE_505_length_9196_cov_3.893591_7_plen_82_part_00